jgi:hypothetical protein
MEDQGLERSFSAEMSQLINDRLEVETGSDVVPAILAWDLVTQLRDSDPELLNGWLHENAKAFLADMLRRRISSLRSRARIHAGRSDFQRAVSKFNNGDNAALNSWTSVRYVVNDSNTQRLLLDMNGEDLNYAASRYSRSANAALLEEAFLRALAAKVGKKTVGQVFTEDQIDRMYNSISNRTSIVAS